MNVDLQVTFVLVVDIDRLGQNHKPCFEHVVAVVRQWHLHCDSAFLLDLLLLNKSDQLHGFQKHHS